MLVSHTDPIVAIATAAGRGGVGIVRVSGRGLAGFVRRLLGRELAPRHATYLPFADGQGAAIDQGLAIFFPAPHSYTGEDVLELHAHGGSVVLQLLLARCLAVAQEHAFVSAPGCPVSHAPATGDGSAPVLPGLRLAQPGEFTQRAFLNGKIDLAQAEAIADLIDASTEAAARSAARSLRGAFSRDIHQLRDALVHLRMLVEATMDFPEEEDVDFLQQADAAGQLQGLMAQLARVRQRTHQGSLLREGIRVVIAGQPNAGKSSLLNALAGAELAIVTPIAGTTRDKVQQTIQIEGVPLHIIDTAGLRESADEVERIGIHRAWDEIARADVVLFLHDLMQACEGDPATACAWLEADGRIARELGARLGGQVPVVHVWNKADIAPAQAPEHLHALHRQFNCWIRPGTAQDDVDAGTQTASSATTEDEGTLLLSARTGTGLDALRRQLLHLAGWQSVAAEGVYLARERHVQALRRVHTHLQTAQAQLHNRVPALEILAEELRLAQQALNSITGEFTADDLLGVIFGNFCIGK